MFNVERYTDSLECEARLSAILADACSFRAAMTNDARQCATWDDAADNYYRSAVRPDVSPRIGWNISPGIGRNVARIERMG